ncbi:cyclin-J isoform X1 [Myxocyprinus asiaticus]|uniref:cyclin-J isoform X1 n=1 Tax=Myxocyprinus asiaticus TaxID=70543 RepID=UPI0022232888|nr:cyclin-J isoform X1 [Myxocyprinus asiaticus]
MELEGQWWKGELAEDIYQALRYKELRLPAYKGQSPQLSLRRYFADLIAIVSNRFKLCPAARHLAVYLLDLFMDRYDVSVQQLHMVALSCLLLASKFEEREDCVPKLETLNSLGCMSSMNLVLTKQALLHMELLLLETFQWNLYLPTAAHFIEYYLPVAMNETDLHDGWPMACMEKTMMYMSKYADYFLEVSLQGALHKNFPNSLFLITLTRLKCLQFLFMDISWCFRLEDIFLFSSEDHAFLRFVPSLVAAACVASSRVILRLSPTWPPRLQRLSAYTWEQLLPCVERLLIAHDSDVKEANQQKCQQPSVRSAQTAYPIPHQYMQQPNSQYVQQNCQPVIVSAPSHNTYLTHATSMQVSKAPLHEHGQPQTMCAPMDAKVNMPSRVYQVNALYPCTAPCFHR